MDIFSNTFLANGSYAMISPRAIYDSGSKAAYTVYKAAAAVANYKQTMQDVDLALRPNKESFATGKPISRDIKNITLSVNSQHFKALNQPYTNVRVNLINQSNNRESAKLLFHVRRA